MMRPILPLPSITVIVNALGLIKSDESPAYRIRPAELLLYALLVALVASAMTVKEPRVEVKQHDPAPSDVVHEYAAFRERQRLGRRP
jgi:hypothetical protein